jgi:hypothetical protein
MRLYRSDDMMAAVQWAGTQDEAARLWGRNCWELVEVPTDKPGLLAWLNAWGDRPANKAPVPIVEPAPPSSSYAAQSVAIDDAWEGLPLARKLHLAALALEEARAQLK